MLGFFAEKFPGFFAILAENICDLSSPSWISKNEICYKWSRVNEDYAVIKVFISLSVFPFIRSAIHNTQGSRSIYKAIQFNELEVKLKRRISKFKFNKISSSSSSNKDIFYALNGIAYTSAFIMLGSLFNLRHTNLLIFCLPRDKNHLTNTNKHAHPHKRTHNFMVCWFVEFIFMAESIY